VNHAFIDPPVFLAGHLGIQDLQILQRYLESSADHQARSGQLRAQRLEIADAQNAALIFQALHELEAEAGNRLATNQPWIDCNRHISSIVQNAKAEGRCRLFETPFESLADGYYLTRSSEILPNAN